MTKIPFNRPPEASRELEYLGEVLRTRRLGGGGKFTRACETWLEAAIGSPRVLLTTSCTAALEMAAMLSGIGPGDEIIMPSFTFPSTANAFVLRGATPVFVDIREDTLCIDEAAIEDAINEHTRAIVPMHYGGVGAEMGRIMEIAKARGLIVIEDAAQALCARHDGRPLGSFGELAALSFHESKNVVCGEGGALLINDPSHHRTRRHHSRQGDRSAKILRSPGRQIYLGRYRLILYAERAAERISAGAARGGRGDHGTPARRLGPLS